jgi:regulator of sigma E protease
MMDIVWFLIVVGVIIFVHELGHFLAAKSVGMKVERFSIGFPPRITSFRYKDTEYTISAIPLGGYVKIAGMVDESLDGSSLTGAPYEFQSKKLWQKVYVLCAGVMMNFLLAIIIFTIITMLNGVPQEGPVIVGGVQSGYPAETIGLQKGDRILSIDGRSIQTWQDFVDQVKAKPDIPILLTWIRGTDTLSSKVTPAKNEVTVGSQTVTQGYLGVEFQPTFRKVTIFEAAGWGAAISWEVIWESLRMITRLVRGRASITELTGPIGIAQLSGETARIGFVSFLGFIGLISVSIGLLNILPLPVLDGGHVLIVLVEGVIRRTISTRIKLVIQQIGLVLLIALVLVVSYHDVIRVFFE